MNATVHGWKIRDHDGAVVWSRRLGEVVVTIRFMGHGRGWQLESMADGEPMACAAVVVARFDSLGDAIAGAHRRH